MSTCNGNDACVPYPPTPLNSWVDSVGLCSATCVLTAPCPADNLGARQLCVFFSSIAQVQFEGLACTREGANSGADASCAYLNDCQSGYQCYAGRCKRLCDLKAPCPNGPCTNVFGSAGIKEMVGLCP